MANIPMCWPSIRSAQPVRLQPPHNWRTDPVGAPRRWLAGMFLVAGLGSALDLLSKLLVISGGHFHVLNDARLLGLDVGGAGLTGAVVSSSVAVAYVVLGYRERRRFDPIGVGLVVAGSLGNAADRGIDGFVVDFLCLPGSVYVNPADLMVAFGLALGIRALVSATSGAPDATAPQRPFSDP